MKAVCEALGVARSNIAASLESPLAKPLKRVGRPAKPDDELVQDIQTIIGGQPTYGYRRVWALLKRQIIGTHHWVSPKHLEKYVQEMTWRLNRRKMTPADRMNALFESVAGALPFCTMG